MIIPFSRESKHDQPSPVGGDLLVEKTHNNCQIVAVFLFRRKTKMMTKSQYDINLRENKIPHPKHNKKGRVLKFEQNPFI